MENTKSKYLFEALRLFGERGFDSVSMKDLAKAVGLVPSALYKHFANKQALYDGIVELYKAGYAKNMQNLKVDFADRLEEKESLAQITEEEQILLAKNLFQNALHNEWARNFRKFMTVEQYHNQELAELYDKTYYKDQVKQHGAFFRILMDAGKMKEGNEYFLALQYISILNLLICMCDREPEQEEWALEELEKHVKEFNKNYRIG
ncbi:MAG: TetR/AcrR family transcriptional regulator [Treponema sp.]|nr:TetR/AcrR family transcriptional regulator [Treponema sp.]